MSICKAEGFTLKAYNWAESSRTIVFFTRERGRLALTDKGGRSLTGRRGRAIPFARLALTYYDSEKSGSGYLSEVSVEEVWRLEEGDGGLGRITFGAMACEILRLILPEDEPHVDIYSYSLRYFGVLEAAPRNSLYSVFICFVLRLVSQLGYRPVITGCVGCSRLLDDAPIYQFSPERGGLICALCQTPGERYISVTRADLELTVKLQACSLDESAQISVNQEQSSRLIELLMSFLSAQTGVNRLQTIEFLDKLKKAHHN